MKIAFFVFALSFLAAMPAFSSQVEMTPEEDAKVAVAVIEEVDELNRLLDEEEIIDTGSTVGNGMPITPTAEETTL